MEQQLQTICQLLLYGARWLALISGWNSYFTGHAL